MAKRASKVETIVDDDPLGLGIGDEPVHHEDEAEDGPPVGDYPPLEPESLFLTTDGRQLVVDLRDAGLDFVRNRLRTKPHGDLNETEQASFAADFEYLCNRMVREALSRIIRTDFKTIPVTISDQKAGPKGAEIKCQIAIDDVPDVLRRMQKPASLILASVEDFNEAREAHIEPDEPELELGADDCEEPEDDDDEDGPDMMAVARHIAAEEMA